MSGKNKLYIRNSKLPAGVGIGLAVCLGIAVLLTGILAMLINGGKIAPDKMGYGVLAILMLSSILGAIIACTRVEGMAMIVSVATAMAYFVSLLAITALFFDGAYQGVGVTALVVLGGGMTGGLLRAGKGSSKKRHRAKRRYG